MLTPLQLVQEKRRQAVWRLFENKFNAQVRITVGLAACENAAGAQAGVDAGAIHTVMPPYNGPAVRITYARTTRR